MERTRLGGMAMLGAVLATMATMALHPTGHDIMRDPGTMVARNVFVHALGLFAAPLAAYGAFVLARSMAGFGAFSELGFAFHAVSAVGTVMAATLNGLVAPNLLLRVGSLEGTARETMALLLNYNSSVNQAFARVLVVGSSIAILIWSIEILRTRAFPRAAGAFGCIAAVLILLAVVIARIRLDIHGFGAVVILQSAWYVWIGWQLMGKRPA